MDLTMHFESEIHVPFKIHITFTNMLGLFPINLTFRVYGQVFRDNIMCTPAWYLEMYDVSFRRHTQVSHVRLGQQQQSLSCDVILPEDFGVPLQLSITYTAHTLMFLSWQGFSQLTACIFVVALY